MEAWKAEAAKEGVTLEPRVRTSASAYDGILEEAGELQPDLIIMGRHGYTGLTRLLMGSVTARVIGHSPCHVLVVPQGVPLSFERLLMASDGSPFSEAAWDEALTLAKTMGSALIGVAVAASDRDIPTATEVVRNLEAAASAAGHHPGHHDSHGPAGGGHRQGGGVQGRQPHHRRQPRPHRPETTPDGLRGGTGHRPRHLPGAGGEEEVGDSSEQ